PPDLCPAYSGVFQRMYKAECYFINGTEKVRFVKRYIYNREQLFHLDSNVGLFVGGTPYGEKQAHYRNSKLELLEYKWSQVDMFCRHNYEVYSPLFAER
ncbi:HB2L protein, partial [Hirundo rustica]|nr:HB2L protein [Hirundo rustica]